MRMSHSEKLCEKPRIDKKILHKWADDHQRIKEDIIMQKNIGKIKGEVCLLPKEQPFIVDFNYFKDLLNLGDINETSYKD